jgi:hypothetical protein
MNETEMLALGEALARTANVLRPDEQVPFRDYVRRVLGTGEGQLTALFGDGTFVVSVDGRPVDGCDSAIPVTADSRIVLYRRHGPMLDVLNRGVIRQICLN